MEQTKGIHTIGIAAIWFLGCLLPAQSQSQPFQTFSYPKGEITSLGFSSNGQLLAFSRQQGLEQRGQVVIWDWKKRTVLRTIEVPSWVETLHFSPSSELLAVGYLSGGLQLWDLRSGRLLHTWRGGCLTSFSQDNRTLVSLSINTYMRGPGAVEILRWDVLNGKFRRKVRIPLKPNYFAPSFALSRDGKLLALSVDHTIIRTSHSAQELGSEMRLYDAQTGKLTRVWQKAEPLSEVMEVQFSPDSRVIATGDRNGRLILRDVRSNAIQRIIFTGKQTINHIAFSSYGKRLASYAAGKIQIWNYRTGTLRQTLTIRRSNYNSVAFSPDDKMLAGVDAEDFHGRVNLWRIN